MEVLFPPGGQALYGLVGPNLAGVQIPQGLFKEVLEIGRRDFGGVLGRVDEKGAIGAIGNDWVRGIGI